MKRVDRSLLLAAVVLPLVLVSQPALPAPLSRSVYVVVSNDDGQQRCGPAEVQVTDRVVYVLTTSRWTVTEDPTADFVYVMVNGMPAPTIKSCIFSVSVRIYRKLKAPDGRLLPAITVEEGGVGIWDTSSANDKILDNVESALKSVIGQAETKSL